MTDQATIDRKNSITMANYSISANQLKEGTNVLVRGKLAFARLTRLIEGQELAASDQRKVQNGMSPVGKPHTTATITEAEVQFTDPANPTVEEQFVSERRYDSKKNPDSGKNYSIDSKGNNLPVILIPSDAGTGSYVQDTSRQELAQGLDVTLVLRVYKPKSFNNRGLALEQVIVHETPRYYNGGGVDNQKLAAHGIIVDGPIQPIQAQPAEAGSAVAPGDAVVGTEVEDGLSFPAPVNEPEAAPAPQVQATAAPVQPVAAQTPVPAQAQEETPEQKLARLERENAALKAGGSAVGAPTTQGPWNGSGEAQAGITYQG